MKDSFALHFRLQLSLRSVKVNKYINCYEKTIAWLIYILK